MKFPKTLNPSLHCSFCLMPSRYAVGYQYSNLSNKLFYQRQNLYSESIYFTTIDSYHDTDHIITMITIILITVIYIFNYRT